MVMRRVKLSRTAMRRTDVEVGAAEKKMVTMIYIGGLNTALKRE
jgi:hypothetical protein